MENTQTTPKATEEETKKVAQLVKAAKVGLFTTISEDGSLVSRPLAIQEVEFDGDLWFFSQEPSHKVDEIRSIPQVNVSMESGKGYLSISGTAEVVHDQAKVDELWNTRVQAWFPEGREDPSIALIKVHADTAEYWATDDPKVVVLLKVAKAAATGGQPDIGENKTVQL